MLSKTDIIINQALEANGGNRVLAAQALGIKASSLYNRINKVPELFNRWSANSDLRAPPAAPPPPRPPTPGPPTEFERKEFVEEFTGIIRLRKGLERLQLTPEQVLKAEGYCLFHQECFLDSFHINGGQTTEAGLILSDQLKKCTARLDSVRLEMVGKSGEERAALAGEEKDLNKMMIDIAAELRQSFDTQQHGMLLAANVSAALNNRGPKDNKKNGRPRFEDAPGGHIEGGSGPPP